MYSIFLYDSTTTEYAELDTENIDLETVFSISDISDISSRKDIVTKSISFKGTSKNNLAFGNLFHLNKYSDISLPSKLFYNYTPINRVDCLVYEDSMLLINGELIVTGIDIDKNGNILYQAYITGKFIGFKGELGDKLLTDLNFLDLKHRYYPPHIVDSWGGYIAPGSDPNSVGFSRTQRYDVANNTYYYTPFQRGAGYCYVYIDYGHTFKNPNYNQDYRYLHLHNYRPAIWVREYFNRIIQGAGFTYEIKGDSSFTSLFDKLIVPNASEGLAVNTTENRAVYSTTTTQGPNFNKVPVYAPGTNDNPIGQANPVKFTTRNSDFLIDYSVPFGDSSTPANKEQNVLVIKRNFNSDCRVRVNGWLTGNNPGEEYVSVQLCRRNFTISQFLNVDETRFDDVIGEQKFRLLDNENISFNADFIVPAKDYVQSDQLQVRVLRGVHDGVGWSGVQIDGATLEFSSYSNIPLTYSINGNTDTIDMIVPEPPANIKQFDFIRSIINLLNLYCYTKKDNPKHLIFEQYDYYYALTSQLQLNSTAIDWTMKVNFNGGFKYTSNAQIPKRYQFTYKEDADYINKYYKDRFSEIYGSFKFEDSLGFTDEKKVELIFSPSPMVSIPGNFKHNPLIAQGGSSLATKKPVKSNIRILVYNGVHACNYEQWCIDEFNTSTGAWGIDFITAWNFYANCSNYVFDESTDNFHSPRETNGLPKSPIPLKDLNFASPKEYYFYTTSSYTDLPTAYNNYIAQITELTNPNLFTVECQVLLNEVDIANLDLKVPVFIDLQKYGYSYFKVLKVEYTNSKTTSTVTLQKIA